MKKIERKCARHVDPLKEKDVEIANLKAQLSLKEAEATEVIHLRNQVSVIEAAKAARVSELNSLKERNSALEEEKDVLEGKVATLESATPVKETEVASLTAQTAKLTQDLSSLELSYDELSVKAASLESQSDGFADQDEQVKVLSDRLARLDSELMALALHLDEEFYPRFLTMIASRRWIISRGFKLIVMKCLQSPEYVTALGTVISLAIDKGMKIGLVVGIDHEKAGRGLADVAAYDPFVEAKALLLRLWRLAGYNLHMSNSYCLSIERRIMSLSERLLYPTLCGPCSVQKIKEGALSRQLSISNAIGVLADPLSSGNLIGESSTSRVPVTAVATTALAISITAANISSIPLVSVADYDMLDA
ncbi:hypothetical protein Tco_1485320 [Tanacetum coccineum]